MKRYIVDKSALNILNITTLSAQEEMAKNKVITDEPLHYVNLPFLSLLLSDEQVSLLNQNGVYTEEEIIEKNVTHGIDYEIIRSAYYKAPKQAARGTGVKVGSLDSGCNTAVVPMEHTVNFADANPFADVFGHGTRTASIIKHPSIGLAPGCDMYGIKIISDDGSIGSTAAVAGLDYSLTNNLDIVSLSWQTLAPSVLTAVTALVNNGTLVCASSGNSTVQTAISPPAGMPGVIAVNAITESGDIFYKSVDLNVAIPGCHGIDIACAGVLSATYSKDGILSGASGTSFSAPFFAGVLAIYKELLGYPSNSIVLAHAKRRALKTSYPLFFGNGTPSF